MQSNNRAKALPIKLANCQIINLQTGQPVSIERGSIYLQDRLIHHIESSDTFPSREHVEGNEIWTTIDLQGAYVLPGLCDAHVHVTAVTADLKAIASLPPSLVTARSSLILRDMLFRGFTTVRDAGGCDWVSHCSVWAVLPSTRYLVMSSTWS
jgi:imidazolonepropionase-like amidohydrolase